MEFSEAHWTPVSPLSVGSAVGRPSQAAFLSGRGLARPGLHRHNSCWCRACSPTPGMPEILHGPSRSSFPAHSSRTRTLPWSQPTLAEGPRGWRPAWSASIPQTLTRGASRPPKPLTFKSSCPDQVMRRRGLGAWRWTRTLSNPPRCLLLPSL